MSDTGYDNTASDPQALAAAETLALEPFWKWLGVDWIATDAGPRISHIDTTPSNTVAEDHGNFYYRISHAHDHEVDGA